MTSTVTITLTLNVESDGSISKFGIHESGIPPEDDDDDPQTPEGKAAAAVHEALRDGVLEHNEMMFNNRNTNMKRGH